jgi:TRAP-type transport system small permease protein
MRRAASAIELLAGVLLIALMVVTGVDVIGRYILTAPLPGAFEMTEILLVALVFAALPLVSREGGHIEVDLLVAFLPGALLRALAVFGAILSAGVLIFVAWQLARLGSHQWAEGARSISLRIPYAPFALLGAAGCALAAIYGLVRGFRG